MQKSYRRLVVRLREDGATSRKILVKGKSVHNPIPDHPDVCPFQCRKDPDVQVSHFLTRHHVEKNLALFSCEGCSHILFKALIIPTDSIAPHVSDIPSPSMTPDSIETTSESKTSLEDRLGFTKLHSTSITVLDRQASKRITIPKKWIPNIELTTLNTHLIKDDATGRSYMLIELPPMNKYDYMLSEQLYKTLLSRGCTLICRKCEKPIEIGEVYHRSDKGDKIYHKTCWDSLFIEA